jgi:hypothetical protein
VRKLEGKEYPLYPELSRAGAEEAQQLVERFKEQMKKAADEAISDLYCDIAVHIESDSWTNYRNKLMDGFKDYNNRLVQGEFDFKDIRQQIYKEFREDIIKDLDQDNLKRIADLETEVERLRRWVSR